MEPSDLNSSPDGDAALAALFRTHTPALPDDGFSARVLSALPPRKGAIVRSGRVRWPWAAYIGGSLAGISVIISQAGNWPEFVAGMRQLTNTFLAVFATLSDPWLAIALILTALSVVIALPFTRTR